MSEPQIRYCKTKDGVRIAYTTYGQGPPLVWLVDFPWSHLQMETRELSRQLELIRERTIVRFDARGLGMSDREVEEVGMEARQSDIEAVVDVLGLGTFDLLAIGFGGPTAIAFAAAHPDRIARLVLLNSFASPRRAFRGNQQSRALTQLANVDWEMFSENLAAVTFGWGSAFSKRAGEFIRATVTQEMFGRIRDELSRDDVTDLLPQVQAQTLVVQHSGFKPLTLDSGRTLATAIPNARMAVVEGSWQDGPAPIFRVAADFLMEGSASTRAPVTAMPATPTRGGFATILFTDVEGSTALTDHFGDAAARDILREHERITREALTAHGGSEVKTMGDGFMASFGSTTKALECAIAIQQAFAEDGGAGTGKPAVRVRIGLNAGEPIAEDDDLFGTAVIVAARITAKAEGGEILVSDVVRQLVAGKGFLFNDRGEHALKGFEEPVRVYEVSWRA